MEKRLDLGLPSPATQQQQQQHRSPPTDARPPKRYTTAQMLVRLPIILVVLLYCAFNLVRLPYVVIHDLVSSAPSSSRPYGTFPRRDDPFHFLPCTNVTLPPALDDPNAETSWARLYDPDPRHWSWGRKPASNDSVVAASRRSDTDDDDDDDPYAGRGIYLCGYLDVPLDYSNRSDDRIVRLAVTKFQVSGLAPRIRQHRTSSAGSDGGESRAGTKSARTLVINPGGPGGSGTSYVWRAGEQKSRLYTEGRYDVLGWDPRGVNATQPSVSCFPYDADRDRWGLYTGQFYRTTSGNARPQLDISDAMGEAVMAACHARLGDLPRFVSTGINARDIDEIRRALGEDELTANMVSYGTGLGQTYVNLFPHRAGRIVLDGTEYVRDHRLLGGFGWTALDNVTDAYRDGFLGECVHAGPDHCDLARPLRGHGDEETVTLRGLEARMSKLFDSVLARPVPGYLDESGPSLLDYSTLIGMLYSTLYNAKTWPMFAKMLSQLEGGNATLAIQMADASTWEYDPSVRDPRADPPASDELFSMVVCSDSYDAPARDLDYWQRLWSTMARKDFIAGDGRFYDVLPCRHFAKHWPHPVDVYRGDLNHTLRFPTLLVAETYDPATPLRNGRRLLAEMGRNARLIAHHGYGHSSRDTSKCTDTRIRDYLLHGTVQDEAEVACYADEKPYLYGVTQTEGGLETWRQHAVEMKMFRH
ncbi:uncharacterized protein PFL1_06126 [Pseudozyma flocculosa PF-1]|uniref:AB hydrolase-1 domain-containing protein n=2 Tax=Pseudozyma flocculosa TaxID=84751 RepID=A0A5C3F6N9_9BASI|nr:uncharacterized protein PFL1_06126 [Pseudozyma flocculosa PF-1]EPQ26190.1 hypothetical protein PFL1_06126 [Pseudozyma flocculosa PF-1]SPO40143.1 uncharacterized protein PSFLO_05625 [Pseudozyma flocculosa]